MKLVYAALLAAAALLTAAAPAQACTADGDTAACAQPSAEAGASRDGASARRAPRIIFGESLGASFEFRERRVPRRSGAAARRAYFGSGDVYRKTLAELQSRMRAITARSRLEALPMTQAQEAAKHEMDPALMRALTLAKQARNDSAGAH